MISKGNKKQHTGIINHAAKKDIQHSTHMHKHMHKHKPLQFILTEQNLIVCHFSLDVELTDCFIVSCTLQCKLRCLKCTCEWKEKPFNATIYIQSPHACLISEKQPPFICWPAATMPRNQISFSISTITFKLKRSKLICTLIIYIPPYILDIWILKSKVGSLLRPEVINSQPGQQSDW